MPRLARNRHWASRPAVNRLHHVTNRGVDRQPIFRSPADRIVFLSILAAVCLDSGLCVHAFCLMTNHFHLLVEDPRGLLSHAMLRLETAYARYFRDSAGRRGCGHVFGDRFFSRAFGSARSYRIVVDYILRNPLACDEPLASSAESYLWSSAPIHIAGITSSEGCRTLVDRFGGIDAILASLPRPGSRKFEAVRRHRMDCLVGGEWLDAEAALQGMAGEQLARRLAAQASEPREARERDDEDALTEEQDVRLLQEEFRGHERGRVMAALEEIAGRAMAKGDVAVYALWRFAREGRRRLARALRVTEQRIERAVARIHKLRETNRATNEALSRLEWRMTFALGGAPWRV